MSRQWWGPTLDTEQRLVLELADDLIDRRLARCGDESPENVDAARRVLADSGLWTLGAAESAGGGGASLITTLFVLARLAGSWPALAWASTQAHAAATVLDGRPAWTALLADVHQRAAPVAVVDQPAAARFDRTPTRLTGVVDRIDPAGRDPHIVLLLGPTTAVVAEPRHVLSATPLRRTGLDGALTVAVQFDVGLDGAHLLEGVDATRASVVLHLGGAAVAAGIAAAATEAACVHSEQRVQFGAPLAQLPTVRDALMRQVAHSRDCLVSAASVDVSQPLEAAAVLGSACDRAIDVAAAAVQSHGGYGYMAEYPVEAMLRDAVSIRCAAGAADAVRRAGDELAARFAVAPHRRAGSAEPGPSVRPQRSGGSS